MEIRYVAEQNVYIAKKAGNRPHASGNIPKLLGARVHVDLTAETNGWVPVTDVPNAKGKCNSGFIELNGLSSTQQLKIFYIDVGQGDASLIEAEKAMVIIDGGPNSGLHSYLKKRLNALRRADTAANLPQREHLFIDAVFVSHFDKDHYKGLVRVLEDPNYKIGTLYHNGLPRYGASSNKDLKLGTIVKHNDGTRSISTDFTGINSARALLGSGNFQTKKGNHNDFWKFLNALINAHDHQESRLQSIKRLVVRDPSAPAVIKIGDDLEFQVLGPLTTKKTGTTRLPVFPDPHKAKKDDHNQVPSPSHTINGNSIVVRLIYKDTHFLFGGDLNQPAQKYLRDRYGDHFDIFHSDVNKACHHGSSDFDVAYLQDVAPCATVFSSGDDGSYDHPLPDAIGAAAKYSIGDFPLVFSTELARDNAVSGRVKLGHINARSNGTAIVMAQKKESPGRSKKLWHTFGVPFAGPFGSHS
ncbi:MAG: hypothetical protein ABFS18_00320 [Thermodesulfobacteriota bacterium]